MLSENLKTLRRQKGFTQEELAARLNVVRQTVSKWEREFHAVKDTQPALIGIAAHEVVLMRCYAFSCSVYSFQALTCASSQLHQASTPSPVLALIGNISISGLRLCANSRTLSMLKSK